MELILVNFNVLGNGACPKLNYESCEGMFFGVIATLMTPKSEICGILGILMISLSSSTLLESENIYHLYLYHVYITFQIFSKFATKILGAFWPKSGQTPYAPWFLAKIQNVDQILFSWAKIHTKIFSSVNFEKFAFYSTLLI